MIIIKNFIVILLLSLASISSYSSDFTVDGCFECDSENYQLGYDIAFNYNGSNIGMGGLYFGQDSDGVQYLFFKMAEEFVDSYYGPDSLNHGWDHERKFKEILLSDSLGLADSPLEFYTSSGTTVKLMVDLLACKLANGSDCGDKGVKTWEADGSIFESGGYTTLGYEKSDGEVISGSPDDIIIDIETSMGYNGGLAGFNTTNSLSASEGWLSYIGYEFSFKAGTFENWISPDSEVSDFLSLGSSHVSPPKVTESVVPDTGTCIKGCVAVPEPNSIMLFLLALVGFTLVRKKASI